MKNHYLFKCKILSYEEDYSDYRLTIDYPNDLAAARILAELVPFNFSWKDIKKCLDENKKLFINTEVSRYEGLKKSMGREI